VVDEAVYEHARLNAVARRRLLEFCSRWGSLGSQIRIDLFEMKSKRCATFDPGLYSQRSPLTIGLEKHVQDMLPAKEFRWINRALTGFRARFREAF